jgi:hypothetical protein
MEILRNSYLSLKVKKFSSFFALVTGNPNKKTQEGRNISD